MGRLTRRRSTFRRSMDRPDRQRSFGIAFRSVDSFSRRVPNMYIEYIHQISSSEAIALFNRWTKDIQLARCDVKCEKKIVSSSFWLPRWSSIGKRFIAYSAEARVFHLVHYAQCGGHCPFHVAPIFPHWPLLLQFDSHSTTPFSPFSPGSSLPFHTPSPGQCFP